LMASDSIFYYLRRVGFIFFWWVTMELYLFFTQC